MSKTKSQCVTCQWAVWSRTPTGRIRTTEAGSCTFPMDELRQAVLAHAPSSVPVGRFYAHRIYNDYTDDRPCPQHKPLEVTR